MSRVRSLSVLAIILLMPAPPEGVLAGSPRTLYAINAAAETLSALNLETGEIRQNILTTGQTPNEIKTYNGFSLILVNSGTDDVMIIDPVGLQVTKRIALDQGANPYSLDFVGPHKVYVSNFIANSVSVVDLESGVKLKDIEVGTAPEGVLVCGGLAFIANTGYTWGQPYTGSSVSIIDIITDSVMATVPLPVNPQHLALDPLGRVHVSCTGNYSDKTGKIAVIEVNDASGAFKPRVAEVIDIGGQPSDLAITSGGKGYTVAWGDGVQGSLYSYDALADTVIRAADNPIPIGPNVSRLAYDREENVLWIPYMKEWAGDGFVQMYDVKADTIISVSGLLGAGTQAVTIMEPHPDSSTWVDARVELEPGSGSPCLLAQNYPNPFNTSTLIDFRLEKAADVALAIYDLRGNNIRTLAGGNLQAGDHCYSWDGKNTFGQTVPSGTYFCRLKAGGLYRVVKMSYLR